MALLSEGRFTLGLGAGENLNEHVVGQGWQPANVRHEKLTEAVEIIRALFGGGYVDYRGAHFDVDSGFTDLALVQIGGDQQDTFLDWAPKELLPALREL